ncbi:laforin-like isoform X2 [Camarhynchus parvulus]|uniref:laforin-like isoform X2 n=1 Tax=Geospiza parvula TaxID=87175 RepID=UPI001238325B|nr:laforin-like isoform X2 [Camarhynchus parvulus]
MAGAGAARRGRFRRAAEARSQRFRGPGAAGGAGRAASEQGCTPRGRAGPSPGAGSDGGPENPGGAAAAGRRRRRRSGAVALPALSAAMSGRSGLAPVPSRRLPVCVNFCLASQLRAGEWEKGPRWLPCPRWAESSDLGRMGCQL